MSDENEMAAPVGAGRAVRAAWDKLRETDEPRGLAEDQGAFDHAGAGGTDHATGRDAMTHAPDAYPGSEPLAEPDADGFGEDISAATDPDIDTDEILGTDLAADFSPDYSGDFNGTQGVSDGQVEPMIPKSEDDEASDDEYPMPNPPV